MAYRVFDKKKKKFIEDNIFLASNSDLYKSKWWGKPTFLHEDRYVFQKAIELTDKNGVDIYVGDYLNAQVDDDRVVQGMVTFADELAAYVILCWDTSEFFTLGTDVCNLIEVIGNVFDEDKKRK